MKKITYYNYNFFILTTNSYSDINLDFEKWKTNFKMLYQHFRTNL